jgi:large subunit ribosomal protein L24
MAATAHVRKGDMVVVTKGREAGKRGKVKRVLGNGRVEVEGLNMVKRHVKPTQLKPQGGIDDKEGSIALPNVMLWCETCGAGRRSGIVLDAAMVKSRVCRKCATPFRVATA